MKIGKYISELLFENDFVILPQLGEFTTKYIPARFIPELKKVESPSKIVAFDSKNKTGGGLLIDYIAKKENMTVQQSKSFVETFVAEMQNSLKGGKKVELESIGVFSLDAAGILSFEPDKSINYLSDSLGLSSVNEPVRKSEEAAKSDLDKIIENATKPTPEPTPVREPVKPVIPIREEPVKKQEPVKSERPPVVPVRAEKEPAISRTSYNEPYTPPQSGGLSPAMKWVAFTVVPLLIIIIILAFNYDFIFGEKSLFRGNNTPVQQTRVAEPAQEVPAATQNQQQPVQNAPATNDTFDPTVAPPAPERGRLVYYLIVGSFEEEHSAMILAEDLRTKGARNASILPTPQGFYRVYYGYYYSEAEAQNDMEQARRVHPEPWILQRNNR
jgi:hypothetical protein